MVRPDVDMVREKSGQIFHGGKHYIVFRSKGIWYLIRAKDASPDKPIKPICSGGSVDDCCTWLMANSTCTN
jgi:hypothetical protein